MDNIEFLLYRGFPRPIWTAKYHERSEGYFEGQIDQGNRRRSNIFNFPAKLLYTILEIIFRTRQITRFFAASEPEKRMFFGGFWLLGASIFIRSLTNFQRF